MKQCWPGSAGGNNGPGGRADVAHALPFKADSEGPMSASHRPRARGGSCGTRPAPAVAGPNGGGLPRPLSVGIGPLSHRCQRHVWSPTEVGDLIERGGVDPFAIEMADVKHVALSAAKGLGEHPVGDLIQSVVEVPLATARLGQCASRGRVQRSTTSCAKPCESRLARPVRTTRVLSGSAGCWAQASGVGVASLFWLGWGADFELHSVWVSEEE